MLSDSTAFTGPAAAPLITAVIFAPAGNLFTAVAATVVGVLFVARALRLPTATPSIWTATLNVPPHTTRVRLRIRPACGALYVKYHVPCATTRLCGDAIIMVVYGCTRHAANTLSMYGGNVSYGLGSTSSVAHIHLQCFLIMLNDAASNGWLYTMIELRFHE